MRAGLFSKMAATYTVIIAVSFSIIAAVISFWFRGYYMEVRRDQLNEAKEQINEYAAKRVMPGTTDNDTKLMTQKIMSIYSNLFDTDIVLLDKYGWITEVSNIKHQYLLEKQINIPEKDLQKLKTNVEVEEKGVYEEIFSKSVYIREYPIVTNNGSLVGVMMMSTPENIFEQPLRKVYYIIWGSAIAAIIVSCIVIYYFSQRIIIRPLSSINTVAGKISKGEVEKRVPVQSKDEIGELAKSFNSMADSIEEVEKNRRDFISNVSHEIRSPITSIKGFIGGILDGVIPKEKENYYLSIAYEEIQRLTRLINDLLDLSAIESGRFSLRIEELDINELIRLCVIKSETKIKNKKLNVDVYLDMEGKYVAGDRDRLTQVVTNLLDNAIKYVNDGGNIKITTKARGEKVFVSVFNDGPSIPKEDLKHIWERFYKSDKARTSKISTGLGLPIVRSILTQLGEDILVENREEGVTFTFTLKRV